MLCRMYCIALYYMHIYIYIYVDVRIYIYIYIYIYRDVCIYIYIYTYIYIYIYTHYITFHYIILPGGLAAAALLRAGPAPGRGPSLGRYNMNNRHINNNHYDVI